MLPNDENKTPPLAEAGLNETMISGQETSSLYPNDGDAANTIRPVQPDLGIACDFLQRLFPDGMVTLTAIPSDPAKLPAKWPKGAKTLTRTLQNTDDLQGWLENAHANALNVYYTANQLAGKHSKKPNKTDFKAALRFHCDCDPRAGENLEAEQQRILEDIRKHPIPPTAVVFSGGGYQCLWELVEPFALTSPADILAAENRNRWLGQQFLSADNTQNIDRILRLPGSVNHPDAKKLKKGRVAALAYVVEELTDWNRRYRLEDIPESPPPTATGMLPDAKTRNLEALAPKAISEVQELDTWNVAPKLREWIVSGQATHHPSRSETVFAVVCGLLHHGVPDDVVLGIILDKRYRISESVLEKPHPLKYALRQLHRAATANSGFDCDESGKIKTNNLHNIRVAMAQMGVDLAYDEFLLRAEIRGLPKYGPWLDDDAVRRLWLAIDERFGFRPDKALFWDVVEDTARQCAYHPVREYLDGLAPWDGVPRLDTWLSVYGGAEDTPYTRAVGRLPLIAAVRRIRSPGCKFDEMLVLEGNQGTNKSSALKVLAVNPNWFSDDLPLNIEGKRVIELLAGRWIIEAAELNGLQKHSNVENSKALLSRQRDDARMAYDRKPKAVPRQCIFIGTTNSSQYLRDTTGNRRFWPVKITGFDVEALQRDRDQLWAEAVRLETQGESITLENALWPVAEAEQALRAVDDPFTEHLAATLGDMCGKIAARDVWQIMQIPTGQRTQDHNRRVGEAMRNLGWVRTQLRCGRSKPERAYARGTAQEREQLIVVCLSEGNPPTAHYAQEHKAARQAF
jgi:hypothetical protein